MHHPIPLPRSPRPYQGYVIIIIIIHGGRGSGCTVGFNLTIFSVALSLGSLMCQLAFRSHPPLPSMLLTVTDGNTLQFLCLLQQREYFIFMCSMTVSMSIRMQHALWSCYILPTVQARHPVHTGCLYFFCELLQFLQSLVHNFAHALMSVITNIETAKTHRTEMRVTKLANVACASPDKNSCTESVAVWTHGAKERTQSVDNFFHSSTPFFSLFVYFWV